ncbi:MAG: CotH kinase family protein [Eubacterium sp.]|nr:CotH kinase family protein [Eubacterium sp.]
MKQVKIIISFVLVIVMAFGFGVPKIKAQSSESSEKSEHYTYDGAEVPEAFQRNQMTDLFSKIVMPSNMSKVKVTKTEDGVKFSGKRSNLQAGRVDIAKQFHFGENYVGRFSIEATRAVTKPITIKFYIDADINPFCSMTIGREGRIDPVTKEEKWEQSKVVIDEAISGSHSLSFSFETACEETEVTFKSFEFVQSSLPVINFDIDENEGTVDEMNTSEDHSAECHGDMTINVPARYANEYVNNLQTASYPIEYIRGRGNSTWACDKKPYKVKLAKKNGLLGMPANKHWVLLANSYDNSKMRNKMTYELGNRMNVPYTPKSVPVDVVMNGEYYGTYFLSEQIRLGENRVDIPDLTDTTAKLTEEEITGGYLLSLGGEGDEPEFFTTTRNNDFFMESPQLEDWQNADTSFDEVKEYIQGYVQKCEDALYNSDYCAPDGTSYSNLIDVDRMITYYLFQEISQNGDAYAGGSNYLYKDRNGKLCWGPLWDFDYVAWAGSDYDEEPEYNFQSSTRVWNGRMLLNDDCWLRLQEIYSDMKTQLLDIISDNGYLDQLYDSLSVSMHYDIEKNGFYDHAGNNEEPYVYSFKKERDRLKDWIRGKLAYTDENMTNWRPEPVTVTFTVDGEVVSEQKLLEGEKAVIPDDPVKEGYAFLGWYYIDCEGEESKLDPDRDYDKDTTIFAKFVANKDIVPVADIVTRTDDVFVELGSDTYSISYKVNPANATFEDCTITSSNPDVAKVDDEDSDVFLALKSVGESTITLTSHNGISKQFVIHVVPEDYDVDLSDVEIEDGPIKLKMNESRLVNFTLDPENAPWTNDIEFIVGNEDIVEMEHFGIITAKSPGKTFILARYGETNKLIEVEVEGEKPKPTPVVKKDALTLYGEFLKANKIKYYSVLMQSKANPLLIVTNKVYKGKYGKSVTVYTIRNNKVIKVGNLKSKKGYLKIKSNNIVTKFGKNSIGYYKVKATYFVGNKYVKKKKKYYSYKLNRTKFIKKKKISKRKGKKYLKAKGANSIVFTAK